MKKPTMKYTCNIFLLFLILGSTSIMGQTSSKYQTYAFLDFDVKLLTEYQTSPENIEYLKKAIAKQLGAHGLTRSPDPDLVVNIGVVIEEETQTRETDYRDIRYLGQRDYHWQSEEVVVGVYKVGTIAIELVDTKADKVVWEESDKNVIRNKKGVQKKIDKGVNRIFKKFDLNKLGA